MTSTLPTRLRQEAAATEELNPGDSQIPVMREAAEFIESVADEKASIDLLKAENQVLRQFCADLNNLHRHRFAEAVDKALDDFFKEAAWPRTALRAVS